MNDLKIGNSRTTLELTPFANKEKPKLLETFSEPTSSYQGQVEITSASQKERLGNAQKNARARKLWDQAAQLFYSKANTDPVAFQTTSSSWEGSAVKEVAAIYIAELKGRDQKSFDSVALAKAIALIEHERDFIREPKSSAAASRENIFPEIKDKKEALNEAITELFKAVNQADKDEALASFKNVGSGYINEHFAIVAENSVRAISLACSKWMYTIKSPVTALEEKVKHIDEDVKHLEEDVKHIEDAVKGGKEGVKKLIKEAAKEAANKAANKALDTLSEFVGGVPTAETISAVLEFLALGGTKYLACQESKNQYFNGAEELAPTVVPKMTPGTEDTKDLLRASLATKNLRDANEVQGRLAKSTEDGKDILAKKRPEDSKTKLQLMQKEIIRKNAVINALKSALQDGERVLQAEQDFKNASRNEKITGPGSKQRLARNTKRGINLATMICSLAGAGPVAPAAALLIINLIHLAYHFGGGSISDGEEKMMNTLESALKSDDLIDTSQISRRQIANLYGEYSAVAKKYREESPEELEARQTLQKAVDGKINIDIVKNILQQPVSIRIENGKKLFEGQIAKILDKAQQLEEKRLKKKLTEKEEETLVNGIREKLQLNLTDLAKFHTAISGINEAMQHENEEQREVALNKAYEQSTQLLAEIKNQDFPRLFTGTLKKQLGALKEANREYVDMTPKKNESAEVAKLKMLQVTPRLIAAATVDIVFKGGTSSEIDSATIDQLLKHEAVPKALNFPILKLDGNKESVEVPLTNTRGYYAKHQRMRTHDEKVEIYKAKADNYKNKIANSLFGTPAKILAIQLSMKKTRDARHSLLDDILEGRSVLKELEEPDENPFYCSGGGSTDGLPKI